MGFSAYGEKMLGAGHSFVQSNYAKYLSGARPHGAAPRLLCPCLQALTPA